MYTPRQIFNRAYSTATPKEIADSNGCLCVIKCGIKVSLELKSSTIKFYATCLSDEYDTLEERLIETLLSCGWDIGSYKVGALLYGLRIAILSEELARYRSKGRKGIRASAAIEEEIKEMQIKLNKIENYVRTINHTIGVQSIIGDKCQR